MTTSTAVLKKLVLCALCVGLIAISAQIQIPFLVPFTMQSFAIFFCMMTLGGKYGTFAVLLYLLAGGMGLPVFSGFGGGFSALFGVYGGYLWGFLVGALLFWLCERLFGRGRRREILYAISLQLVVYTLGVLWYYALAARGTEEIGILYLLVSCVFVFVIPDAVKLFLASALSWRIQNIYRREK